MALSGDILGDTIASEFYTGDMTQAEKDALKASWRKIAGKIVDHIKSNAEVSTDIDLSSTVDAPSGNPLGGTATGSGGVS